jgi:hypothetical protein
LASKGRIDALGDLRRPFASRAETSQSGRGVRETRMKFDPESNLEPLRLPESIWSRCVCRHLRVSGAAASAVIAPQATGSAVALTTYQGRRRNLDVVVSL